METPKFKEKIQNRINELNLKQENVGKEIGITSKGNFSSRLKEASKFTNEQIEELAKILKYNSVSELLLDTEIFCEEKFEYFLSQEEQKTCKILELEKKLKEYEEEPLDKLSLAFLSFFGGIITVLVIQFISKFLN